MNKNIQTFLDEHGRLTTWPSDRRRAHQLAILDHLRVLFEGGVVYSQEEALGILKDHATLPNLQVLLDELVDGDYLTKQENRYWRADSRPIQSQLNE